MYGKRRSIRLEGYDYSEKGLYFVTIDLESKKNLLWKKENIFELNEIGILMEKCWLELENRFLVQLDEYVIMPNHFHGILRINRATTRVARTLNPNVGAGFMPAQNINNNSIQNMANTLNPNVGAGFMPAQNINNNSIQNMANTLNPNVEAGFMPAQNINNNSIQNMANTLNPNVGAGFMPAQNINIDPAQNIDINPALGNIIGSFKSIFVWKYVQSIKNQNWPKFFKRLWQRNYYERIIRDNKEYLAVKKYIRNNPKKLLKTKIPRLLEGF